MPDKVTLEQVEELVAQLPPKDQLKLLARIGCFEIFGRRGGYRTNNIDEAQTQG